MSQSFRKLCERALEDLDAHEKQTLRRIVGSGFSQWRATEVTTEPIGLRSGSSTTAGIFRTDADLVMPFIASLKQSNKSRSIAAIDPGHIAAVLLLKINAHADDETFFTEWFLRKIDSSAAARGRDRLAAQLAPTLTSMRKKREDAKLSSSRGGSAPKSVLPLKAYISAQLCIDRTFNLAELTRRLKRQSENTPLVWDKENGLWYESGFFCCSDINATVRKRTAKAVTKYFTEACKKIDSQ